MSEIEHGLRGAYIDSRYQTAIRFGAASPYLQPWRAYSETLPASALANAFGINLNITGFAAPEPVVRHLAQCGVRHARVEVGWGAAFAGTDETEIAKDTAERLRPLLLACREHQIRPLILLNANHGVPVPMDTAPRTLARPARKGDRTAYLADTTGLQPFHSGFNNVSTYKAAEVLFTRIEKSGRVFLSRPLPKDLSGAGVAVPVATLRYAPLGFPDHAATDATLGGWKRYVLAVARFAAGVLSPSGGLDRGFDMEIWNELSFGSDFVAADRYFDPVPFKVAGNIYELVVRATAEVATGNAGTFAGVRLCDGFANTIPWTASAKEPARVTALSKHPYSNKRDYRGVPPPPGFAVVNALLEEEPRPTFYPLYTAAFPEYFFNALQTEHLMRDLSPVTTDLYGTRHGRFARTTTGKQAPFRVWFTEWGAVAKEWGVNGLEAAQNLKARAYLRLLIFAVAKGVERVYFFAANGEDAGLGMVSERLMRYVAANKQLPLMDAAYRSPVLACLKRLTDALGGGAPVRDLRPLTVVDIRDTHDHYQWRGDGTPEHPTLYNRECFVCQAFQWSETRFVLAVYVQTRDMTRPLPPERYTLVLSGFAHPQTVTLSRLYDPVTGASVPGARIVLRDGAGHVAVSLPVTDYPYLLFLDDAP